MNDIDNYLQIMIDSLTKKEELLDRIIDKNRKQYECIKGKDHEEVDWDAFNLLVTEKEIAIDRIIEIDEGFDQTYNIIKDEVTANKEKYRDKVAVLKELIERLTDKGIGIQADEERNRQIIDKLFNKTRQEIKKQRVGMSAASAYYKTMSNSVVRAAEISMLDQKK
ncbi:MAG: flagellar protein FlgN [Lachnospiraceae bacterium]|nr:flagellar protein FlgN [Lachnospiraceae bacterium]